MLARRIIGAVLAVAGTVWFLQGIGVLTAGDSFMINDRKWVLIGAVTAIVGIALFFWKKKPDAS
jgi:hypothetical protein